MTATRRSLLAGAVAAAAGGPLGACASRTPDADPLAEARLAEARGRAGAVPRGMGRVWIFGRRATSGLPSVVLDGQEVYEPATSEAALYTPFVVFRDVPPGRHRVVTSIKGTGWSGDGLAFAVAPGQERFITVYPWEHRGTIIPTWSGGVATGATTQYYGPQYRLGARLVDPEAGRAAAAAKTSDRPSRPPDPFRR